MPIETPGYDEILLGGMSFKVKGGLLNVTELGKFERKITIGDHTKDSQDLLSTWIISDLSGGHGVAWHQTDATVNRYRYATLDVSLPGQWTSRLKANAETGAAATVAMLGDLLEVGKVRHIVCDQLGSFAASAERIAFAKGDKVTIDIDTAGTGAKGLKLYFMGYKGHD